MLRVNWRILPVVLTIALFQGVLAEERKEAGELVEKAVEKARKLSETMHLSENAHNDKGQEAAQQTAKEYNSPEFQQNLRCQIERIQQSGPQQEQAMKTQGNSTLTAQESVYLFLSSSVPETVVNRYLIDIGRTGEQRIVPVLFGLPEGMEGKRINADYFSRVMQADPGCRDTPESPCHRLEVPLKVNPELFTRYNISEVPALVYDNGQDSWSIHGDTELAYLLKKVGKVANSPALAGISARLRGNQ
ncbi:MAG: TrbC family F-type conjugative pilus assembly protein [Desulfobulbus sp.]|nr:TrbC family F-type conjugative pilus assembly protein [Desulfobulbus sp.]